VPEAVALTEALAELDTEALPLAVTAADTVTAELAVTSAELVPTADTLTLLEAVVVLLMDAEPLAEPVTADEALAEDDAALLADASPDAVAERVVLAELDTEDVAETGAVYVRAVCVAVALADAVEVPV